MKLAFKCLKCGGVNMKKNILSILLVCLLFSSSLILFGCGSSQKMFEIEDIVSIYYYEVFEYNDEIRGEIDLDETFIVSMIYENLKVVKYNKNRPEKDFWTRKEIEYKEPKNYKVLNILLKSDSSRMYYSFNGNVYPSLLSMKYSEKGYGAFEIAHGYLVDKQLQQQ